MKNILIFSNPFGGGPTGKALTIAEYLSKNSKSNIFICGSSQLESLAGGNLNFIKVDERNEEAISKVLNSIHNPKYVISSQNRFAIKVANSNNIPCAFLDGLSWFWKKIPDEHFIADIIFWLNYPDIFNKIPHQHKDKIKIISGITEGVKVIKKSDRNNKTLLYIGGCNNPLTQLPTNYLDLIMALIDFTIANGLDVEFVTDHESRDYLKKYPDTFPHINSYPHCEFIKKLSETNKFITNGGQTATLEAASVETPVSFFLPINLSQYALVDNLNSLQKQSCLQWEDYVKIPIDINNYNEKDAIAFFNQCSQNLMRDKDGFNRLCCDFFNLIKDNTNRPSLNNMMEGLGYNGAQDIYENLKESWGI